MNEQTFQIAIRTLSRAERCWSNCMRAIGLAATVVVAGAGAATAQDSLTAARDLYKAAAYEDALVRLDGVRGSPHGADENRFIEQYRAFCLLALGRTSEAEQAIEAVVAAAPAFRPSANDASPRVLSAFSDVRRRVLPGIIQQLYAQSKAAFDRHDTRAANAGFQQVLDLLADADVAPAADQPLLAEIRTLAVGFRDLSATALAAKPAGPAGAVSTPSEPASRGTAKTAVQSADANVVRSRIYTSRDADVAPPVAVRESWAELADVFAVRAGVVEIVIDETGAVETATMSAGVNAVYDRVAISTAKRWRYKPATVNGVAVKFKKVVLLDLKSAR